MSTPITLIVTVGSSPLPVVVAVRALAPERLILLYTTDVGSVKDRICRHLGEHPPVPEIRPIEFKDHKKVQDIRQLLQGLRIGDRLFASGDWQASQLHYTGGTKLMAVQVHRYWLERGGLECNASYLGADGWLYFDAEREPVSGESLPGLMLEELSLLHFDRKPKTIGDEHLVEKRLVLSGNIHRRVCADGFTAYREHLPPLYRADGYVKIKGYEQDVRCDWNAAKNHNFKGTGAFRGRDLTEIFESIDVPAKDIQSFGKWIDGQRYEEKNSGDKERANLKNAQWLYGKWLEVWLAGQLTQLRTHDGRPLFSEVHQNVVIGEEPEKFELDVIGVRGYRAFVFSCTVDASQYLVKHKLFEAANRAARIGGDHARAAVVCLSDKPDDVLRAVQEEHWPGYDTLRLFGQVHVFGNAAPCQVTLGKGGPDITLADGIRDWVMRS